MSTTQIQVPQIQVLVVEDDEVNAQAARTLLERLGCQVDWVVNGAEAIVRFRQETYDLILMDSQMPVMDGFEATARIRGMPLGRVTPIVGTTAGIGRPECLAAGMNDVMPKPFLRENLKLVLSKWTHWDDTHHTELER
jgi:CheY-like chemotaxis protein